MKAIPIVLVFLLGVVSLGQAQEVSHLSISQSHGKTRQMIYGVDRWVNISKSLWTNVSPAVHNPQFLLDAALGTVFSNPKNYLIPGWNASSIHNILIVSKGAEEGSPITIPSALKKKIAKDTFGYDFYLPEGLGAKEILQVMKRLQREISAEENPAQSIVEHHAELTERFENNYLPMEECGEIMTYNQPPIFEKEDEEEALEESPNESIDQLWEKALAEKSKDGRKAWDKLKKIGSDDIIEKLRDIIFSSASPSIKKRAFYTLVSILNKRENKEALLNLLERTISDPHLASDSYSELENLWMINGTQAYYPKIEAIIANQLSAPSNSWAIAFFLSHERTNNSNQLRAVSALDTHLSGIPEQERQAYKKDLSDIFASNDDNPRALLRQLIRQVSDRLELSEESDEELSSLGVNRGDELYFINQALPVIVKHLQWMSARQPLQVLLYFDSVPDAYKAQIKERIQQLIEEEKAELDQQLETIKK